MSRLRIIWLLKAFTVICALLFITACRNESGSNSAPETKNANTSSASTQSAEIDYGLFCRVECKDILTLQASPISIKGKVGVIVSGNFPYGLGTKRLAVQSAKAYFPNIELVVGNGNSDPVIQTSVVDDFIAMKVDVLVVDLVEKDTVNPALERAKAAGIKVILIDRRTNTEVLTTIKAEDVEVGRKAGQMLVTLLNGKGNIIEMGGTSASSTSIDRNKGIMEAFSGYSDIKVIASQNAHFDQSTGYKVMEDLLRRFPKGQINGLISHADVMTMGAIQAIKEAGREKEIKVVSVDAQETGLAAIETGAIDAIVAYPIVMPMGIIAAAKTLAGEPLPKSIELEAPIVTKENVERYKGKTGY
ncbi:substrate-binding domain-containing protein [Paenibacillus alginolyticus]|uniref:Substrate-binding domain-containing protein n=1 Tax=Paenibacillus alginolyticus TaxID=59839 RepID=A0ABT4GNE1_9BACL|nr:substrate-binding domain-containing protein [Paenibacillus alginolyticus]MCY9697692.1 substrate-binding domain-containing protein [Paenibacillus alginolyticus]MEC0146748.1 substrate-binding domain-containing protein [Paenibacillus alginolyticus]